MTPDAFVAKWKPAELKERSAAQEHWIDVCRMLEQPTPAAADPTGDFYCFERGAEKSSGGDGWADVWFKDHFAVEYKRKRKNLDEAYKQLNLYRESLDNPPLLMVIDLDRFEVHTNFTGTAKRIFRFSLTDIASGLPVACQCDEATPPRMSAIEVLRYAFTSPETLKPTTTAAFVTGQASSGFAKIAQSMRDRGIHPRQAAHFLMKSLFCLFAEDIGLLPEKVFERIVRNAKGDTERLAKSMAILFETMRDGGDFGADSIPWFNGGLFKDDLVLELTETELKDMLEAANLNWSQVEPSIFGTLFERSLDPDQRAQLGAHYTARDDIMLIVEPVVLRPMHRLWDTTRETVQPLLQKYGKAKAALAGLPQGKSKDRSAQERRLKSAVSAIDKAYRSLLDAIHSVKILDPACGSGNFLYVALNELKNLEKQIILEAASHGVGLTKLNPLVEPSQLFGIELNPYAHELAQVVVWIGYIQWHDRNGYKVPGEPILKSLDNIKCMDALLVRSAGLRAAPAEGVGETPTPDAGQRPALPQRPDWPEADFIIGNPPFLGNKKMRTALGNDYVETLYRTYDGDVANGADLSVYWHERSRELIAEGKVRRAGLLATQGIRGSESQETLKRILQSGNIFDAWDDRDWVLAGAAVHVSLVCQDNGNESERHLNGQSVPGITAELTSSAGADLSSAKRLKENRSRSFIGTMKKGKFDISAAVAEEMLSATGNPNGKPNSDVIRPWINGRDITARPQNFWIIDFGEMTASEAAGYELPFEFVRRVVKPARDEVRNKLERTRWWRLARTSPELRQAVGGLENFIGTARVAKHRLFRRIPSTTCPDGQVVVFAREDDYFFGVLHSVAHERWALRLGTQLEDRPRYTPTTSFETFPFPWPPGAEPAGDPLVLAIADAARELNDMRESWLNATGLTEAEIKKRTLTNLYNKRPEWLHLAHLKLDRAVFAAYGWIQGGQAQFRTSEIEPDPTDLNPADLYATLRPNPGESSEQATARQKAAEEEMLKRLLTLNHERAS